MEIDGERRKLAPRETLSRRDVGCGAFFGLPAVVLGGLLLALAFGPSELRHEAGDPPVWLLAAPGSVTTGLGVLFLGSGSRERARRKRLLRAQETQPATPWMWDHPWKTEGVRSAAGRWAGKALALVVVGALLLTPFNAWAFFAEAPWLVKIVTVVFDLLLALALLALGLSVVRHLKYGDPALHFAHFPFRLGEEMNVRLDRPRGLPAGADLRCTLRCIQERIELTIERVRENGEWKNRQVSRTDCDQLWSVSEAQLASAHAPYLEIRFPLPAGEGLSTRLSESPARYWELEIRGDAPGLDYFATFLLPIYT